MNSHVIAKKSKSFSKKTFILLTTQECIEFDDAYKDFPQRSLQSSRGSDRSHVKKDQLIMGPIKTGCWLPGTRVGRHIRQVPWWENWDQKNEWITRRCTGNFRRKKTARNSHPFQILIIHLLTFPILTYPCSVCCFLYLPMLFTSAHLSLSLMN